MNEDAVLLPAEAAQRRGIPTRVVVQAMHERTLPRVKRTRPSRREGSPALRSSMTRTWCPSAARRLASAVPVARVIVSAPPENAKDRSVASSSSRRSRMAR